MRSGNDIEVPGTMTPDDRRPAIDSTYPPSSKAEEPAACSRPAPPIRVPRPQRDAPWHFLNFFPDPHGQGSFRPTFVQSTGAVAAPEVASLRLRARPAPTITGSRFATAAVRSGAGVSAGPRSITSSTPVATGSSGTTSSSTPSAL